MDAHIAQLRADRKLVMELALELAPPPKENLVHQTQKLVPDSSRVPAEMKQPRRESVESFRDDRENLFGDPVLPTSDSFGASVLKSAPFLKCNLT